MNIVRALTADGYIGYDENGKLLATTVEDDRVTTYHISNPLGKICPICNRGWDLTHTSMKDQYDWYARKQIVHRSCFKRFLSLNEWEVFFNAMCNAEIRFKGLKEINNQYRGAWNLTWYEAELIHSPHRIVLGRRKRVYHLEIKSQGSPLDHGAAGTAFKDEKTTKDFGPNSILIHAWTDERVTAYLKEFSKILGLEKAVAAGAE